MWPLAGQVSVPLSPYVDGLLTPKESLVEVGLAYRTGNVQLRPSIRLPYKEDQKPELAELTRYSPGGRAVLALSYHEPMGGVRGPLGARSISLTGEYGYNRFGYHPTGTKAETVRREHSFAVELKGMQYETPGASGAWQIAPQFKLWFSRDWTAADKVGVVGTDTLTGLTLSRNMIVAAPSVRPRLIPSLAFPIYPGSGDFAWAPVASMDLKGAKGDKFAFGDVGRLKLEAWTYYFPTAPAAVNVRFGIAPFASYRAFGTDDFRRWEYGGIVQLWVGSTFFEVL
jgi:hypothetical protein